MKTKAFKAAFPKTLPIMTGYMFLGMAYGFLMKTKGFGIGWVALISGTVFAGSMQYVGIKLLTSTFNPIYVLLLTLMVNARHFFYGLSMLEKYRGIKRLKYFLIFGLADEAFSINCSQEVPVDVDRGWFYFFITLLNYSYWLIFSSIGNIMGNLFVFDTTGLDFVLTALLIVIFLEQWKDQRGHTASLIGLISSFLALVLFGKENFIIPAMILMVSVLTFFRKPIEKGVDGI